MQSFHRTVVNVLISVFLVGVAGIFLYQSINRPRILILHSYDAAYPWVRDVNIGLMRVLEKKGSYSLRWQYMDLKISPSPASRRAAGITGRQIVDEWNPDVIIAIDDDAQDLVARYYVNHPTVKIVFAGLQGSLIDYGYVGAENVTGILEEKPLKAFRTALLDISKINNFRPVPRVLHIADKSPSVVFNDKHIKQFEWGPLAQGDSILVDNYVDWQKKVGEAGQQADYIMVSNYRKLARSATNPSLVPAREVMSWTEANAKIPVIGTNAFNVEDGGTLAIGGSPYEQGQVSARMAVDIIDFNKKPKAIPIQPTLQFVVAMRVEELKKKNIRLSPLYEAFARGTNNSF